MNDSLTLQMQLLLAAFGPPHRAVPAWVQWQSAAGWEEHLDFESYLLLPRVYHHLGGRGVDDALFKRLKGVVKRNWAANTVTMAALGRIAQLLDSSGIVAVLLPPCSLLLRDRSTALAGDTPITYQIARRDISRVTRVLLAAGWRCSIQGVPRWCLPGYMAATARISLRNAQGTTLDLHWVESLASVASGGPLTALQGRTVRSLDTPASIRCLIAGPGMGSDLCRLSRALLLLEKAPDDVGWLCLLEQLHQRDSPFVELVASLSPVSRPSGARTGERDTDGSELPPAWSDGMQPMTFPAAIARRWQRYRAELGEDCAAGRAIMYLPGYLMGKGEMQHMSGILPRSWRTLRYYWRQRR